MKHKILKQTVKHVASALGMIALTTLGPIVLSASAQSSLPLEVADQHPLVKKFQSCVSAVGLEHDLPLADPVPDLNGPGHLYQLNELGRIRDGYRHSLYVSEDQKHIYILQIGGFAGTRKVFGPLDPKVHCSKPAKKLKAKK